jgi:hypothetical protein
MKKFSIIKLALASLALSTAGAQAEIYHFNQTGFSTGSVVSGFFQGHDNNNNGILTGDEVSNYRFSVVGGTFSGVNFEYYYRRPLALSYHLGSTTLGGVAGDFLSVYSGQALGFNANASGGRIFDGFGQVPSDFTSQLITINPVASVPEPESYALMLAGLAALGLVARRKKVAA